MFPGSPRGLVRRLTSRAPTSGKGVGRAWERGAGGGGGAEAAGGVGEGS